MRCRIGLARVKVSIDAVTVLREVLDGHATRLRMTARVSTARPRRWGWMDKGESRSWVRRERIGVRSACSAARLGSRQDGLPLVTAASTHAA